MKDLNLLIHELEIITGYIDFLKVECDGASRLVHLALQRADIDHECMFGSVQFDLDTYGPHFWVEVGPIIIDYRLGMWVGEKWGTNTPHGVFNRQECRVKYYGGTVFFEQDGCELLEQLVMIDSEE